MNNWIPTIVTKIGDNKIVNGTYANLVTAMQASGFDKESGHFGRDHRAIKKPLKKDGTVIYKNDAGNNVTFTLDN
jgi:hypothetical protein